MGPLGHSVAALTALVGAPLLGGALRCGRAGARACASGSARGRRAPARRRLGARRERRRGARRAAAARRARRAWPRAWRSRRRRDRARRRARGAARARQRARAARPSLGGGARARARAAARPGARRDRALAELGACAPASAGSPCSWCRAGSRSAASRASSARAPCCARRSPARGDRRAQRRRRRALRRARRAARAREVMRRPQARAPARAPRRRPSSSPLLGRRRWSWRASTHEGEEAAALDGPRRARARRASPRRSCSRRATPSASSARRRSSEQPGAPLRRRSRADRRRLAAGEVLLLDTLGELAALYAHADVAFVGGTLAPVGGHNVLEPAQAGCPVLFGPHPENARESAALLLAAGARAAGAGCGGAGGGRRRDAGATGGSGGARRARPRGAGGASRCHRAQRGADRARARRARRSERASRPRWSWDDDERPRSAAPTAALALAPLSALSWLYGAGARAAPRVVGARCQSPGAPAVSRGERREPRGRRQRQDARRRLAGLGPRAPRLAGGDREPRLRRARARARSRSSPTGRFVRGRAEVVGDEPMLLAGLAPGVPVLVGRRRDAVGRRAVTAFGAQVLVLDDGFQHHRLAKDVELVTLRRAPASATARVLPRGPLREPIRALSRAHAHRWWWTGRCPRPTSRASRARLPRAARFTLERRPAWTRPLAGGAREPAAQLAGRRVGLLSGIARPAALRETLELARRPRRGGARLPRPPRLSPRGPRRPRGRCTPVDHDREGCGQAAAGVGRAARRCACSRWRPSSLAARPSSTGSRRSSTRTPGVATRRCRWAREAGASGVRRSASGARRCASLRAPSLGAPHDLVLGRLSDPPECGAGALRRDQRSQLLRPLLLQLPRVERRAVPGDGDGAVPESRYAGRLRRGAARSLPPRRARLAGARRPQRERVGPFRIEVLEPLRRLRFVLEPSEHALSFDLHWQGAMPAWQEPRHFIRRNGRVLFDTSRFAQTGCWSGTLDVAGERFAVTPDRWWGTRDRSWGVRPVGEPEPAGIHAGTPPCRGCGTTSRCSSRITPSSTSARSARTACASWRRRCACGATRPDRPITSAAPSGCIARVRHAHPGRLDAVVPGRARRRLLGGVHAAAALLRRDRHRLRHGCRLASRHAPGKARRAGPREEARRDRAARPVRRGRPCGPLRDTGPCRLRPLRARLHRGFSEVRARVALRSLGRVAHRGVERILDGAPAEPRLSGALPQAPGRLRLNIPLSHPLSHLRSALLRRRSLALRRAGRGGGAGSRGRRAASDQWLSAGCEDRAGRATRRGAVRQGGDARALRAVAVPRAVRGQAGRDPALAHRPGHAALPQRAPQPAQLPGAGRRAWRRPRLGAIEIDHDRFGAGPRSRSSRFFTCRSG